MADLTSKGLNLILSKLNDNPAKSADEYMTLHLKVEKYFEWQDRGRWQADYSALADETLDRVAKKLEEGVEIEKSIFSYALGIARFVWLEYMRDHPLPNDIDSIPEPVALKPEPEPESDLRLACLRSCLAQIPKDDEERKLILDYYRKNGEKIKERRKSLAASLGTNTNALKVRMTRLREKLKNCIGKCMEKTLSHV
jgi:DNA-directed RNA polymerase specialized sigma24 family protein